MKPINILGALGIVLVFAALFVAIAKLSGLFVAAIVFCGGFGLTAFVVLCILALFKK